MIDASLVIALLAAITLLAGLAARTVTPYPVVLVLGGLVMGLVPGIPTPRLNPDLVLVLFLPPLLYSSAFLSSVGELRANAVPIVLLAVGLVLATVGGVARRSAWRPRGWRPAARFLLGWSAMRGGVTLALALAIPLQAGPQSFPDRSLVVFLAYGAVLVTLVVPGLTLGPMVRRLGLQQGAARQRQLTEAQATILHAALEQIEALASEDRISADASERLSGPYQARLDRLGARSDGDVDGDRPEDPRPMTNGGEP